MLEYIQENWIFEKEKKMKIPFIKRFPDNFDWGAGCCSYQWSGCAQTKKTPNTNWSWWETSYSRILSLKFSGELEKYPLENFICKDACRHDKRFRSDFTLAKKLGHNAIRCGSEPAKIMPAKGVIDEKEIKRIVLMVIYLKSLGIKVYWNLWHWTIPLWWENEGGWESSRAVEYFAFYVQAVVNALAPLGVVHWITVNETNVFARLSYEFGLWPPQLKNLTTFERVSKGLAQGHIAAYKIIKTANPNAKVGIAHAFGYNDIIEDTAEQRAWKEKSDQDWGRHFIDKIKDYLDFIGINHYMRGLFDEKKKGPIFNDLGWEMHPRAMYDTIMDIWNWYKKPIIITENGCADSDDSRRPWFLWETLLWIHKAIEDGVPIFGYLHWSLMDNFEWAYGFWPRFGLVKIDRENNLKRIPRPSAYLYRDIIRQNGLTDVIEKKYRKIITHPNKR
jgi:beta-glucosidase